MRAERALHRQRALPRAQWEARRGALALEACVDCKSHRACTKKRLDDTAAEVSRRLVVAMETVNEVLRDA